MNVIPKLSGPIRQDGRACPVTLPLTYAGDCPFAGQFPMERAESGLLTFETDVSVPAEGYRLSIEPGKIVLASWDENGAYYGTHTLFQLLREGEGSLPCGVYEDAPKYRYRGFMLDVSRHFFPLEEVKRAVDQCARLKLNVFHWHLSDDQGFRIESKKFPRLNEVGSWRVEEDGTRYGGCYTQEEIKELVAYAAQRYVEVIPEIDLPGHTLAIVAAYPELSCSGEPAQVETHWGIFPRILCGGSEEVYSFLEELLTEVCSLFPSGWFHIGGDEAPKSEWEKCPRCQAEMEKHGLKNEEELQALFTARLAEILEKNGKSVIGWNEILASGKMAPTAAAQYWTDDGAAYSAREIPKGRRFVFSNMNAFYLDYDYSLVTMRAAYEYEPHIPGGESIPPQQVMGLEAPLWTERVETADRLETMIFPRLAAVAENAWSREKDYGDFLRRLKSYEPVWRESGIAFLPAERADSWTAREAAQALIAQFRAWYYAEGEGKVREAVEHLTGRRVSQIVSPTYTAEECEEIAQEAGKAL